MMSNNRTNAPQFAFSSSVFVNSGMSSDQANIIWQGLRKAITQIQNNNASSLRFEELYRNAYTLVLHKHGELLYEGVCEAVADQLRQTTQRLLDDTLGLADRLLEHLVEIWEHHKLIMTMIRDILMYMDKTYCKLQKKVPVYEMGLLQFRDRLLRQPLIRARLQAALLDAVRRERLGERIDRQLMKHALLMLVEVNVYGRQVYIEDFETEFLRATELFYKQESQAFLAQNTVPEYLRKVQERFTEEETRALEYLDPGTKKKLCTVLEQELITHYADSLVENPVTGCQFMFQQNMIEDLRRMYTIFARVPTTLDLIRLRLGAFVRGLGDAIVQNQENLKDPMKFVQDVLDLRGKYSRIVEVSFQDLQTQQPDRQFARALKEAFESFLNRDSRTARYLSTYIDDMLRKGLKEVADSEVDEKLENVIVIFRYLSDKDVFEEYYKKHLASRLLLGKRMSDDIERLVIAKLRTECGHQFTAKLENMFKDVTLSEQMQQEFRSSPLNLNASRPDATELCVSVLTSGSWPLPALAPCQLPAALLPACEHFKQFYAHRHSGRRLQWLTSHGSAELKCSFEKGKRELQVHTYQMCILALYNTATSYTYRQIREATGIPEAELRRHILSLAHPKVKVLVKAPSTKEVHDDHTFSWNDGYTSQLYRVKIPLMSLESVEEKATSSSAAASSSSATGSSSSAAGASAADADLPDSVQQSRQHSVEAAIVRIMKARKTLEHNQLVVEVTKQISHRFPADANFIKKRIEALIEKEYLERDKDDRRVYHYLA